MIQSSIARTRRYNARPPSHPVERVVTMHPHKSSTNRCTKGRHRVRFRISGGWWQRNKPTPFWEGRRYATQAPRRVPHARIIGSLLHPLRPAQTTDTYSSSMDGGGNTAGGIFYDEVARMMRMMMGLADWVVGRSFEVPRTSCDRGYCSKQ